MTERLRPERIPSLRAPRPPRLPHSVLYSNLRTHCDMNNLYIHSLPSFHFPLILQTPGFYSRRSQTTSTDILPCSGNEEPALYVAAAFSGKMGFENTCPTWDLDSSHDDFFKICFITGTVKSETGRTDTSILYIINEVGRVNLAF